MTARATRPARHTLLALGALTLVGCSTSAPAPSPATTAVAARAPAGANTAEAWVGRAAVSVRVTEDPELVWECDFIGPITVPGGWDGSLEGRSSTEDAALRQMQTEAATRGGNFLLLFPGSEPSAEIYLCTE